MRSRPHRPTTSAGPDPTLHLAPTQPGWGLRAGATFDPDQFHVGAHLDAGALLEQGYFVAINPELVYRFEPRSRSRWGFHVGGGLGLNVYNRDDDRFDDRDDTELGLIDFPDAKLTAGISFD